MKVPVGSAGAYCMDATEVTNADYAAFLAANPPTSGQVAWCAWNTSYLPPFGWPATGKENHPVVRVDWCDARAYCKWAGKRALREDWRRSEPLQRLRGRSAQRVAQCLRYRWNKELSVREHLRRHGMQRIGQRSRRVAASGLEADM